MSNYWRHKLGNGHQREQTHFPDNRDVADRLASMHKALSEVADTLEKRSRAALNAARDVQVRTAILQYYTPVLAAAGEAMEKVIDLEQMLRRTPPLPVK